MTNDINGVSKPGLPKIADVAKPRSVESEEQPTRRGAERQPGGGDTVALTDGARLLERVAAGIDAAPSVDVAKVESIREELRTGSYQIDDRAIADKLIASDRERG